MALQRRGFPILKFLHSNATIWIAASLFLGISVSFALTISTVADDANKSIVYDSRGFEPSLFVAGAPLLGADGWSLAIPPFLNPAAAVITRTASSNGCQSIEVWGGDLASSAGITAPYDAVGSYRRPLNYAVTSHKPTIVIDADLMLDTDQLATETDFFSLTVAARSGDGETLGEIGLSSSGVVVAYGFDAAPGDAPAFTAPIESNQWHRVTIELNYAHAATIVSYYVDRVHIGTMLTSSTSKTLLRAAMVVYALPDADGDARADYTARFDNLRVRQE